MMDDVKFLTATVAITVAYAFAGLTLLAMAYSTALPLYGWGHNRVFR